MGMEQYEIYVYLVAGKQLENYTVFIYLHKHNFLLADSHIYNPNRQKCGCARRNKVSRFVYWIKCVKICVEKRTKIHSIHSVCV